MNFDEHEPHVLGGGGFRKDPRNRHVQRLMLTLIKTATPASYMDPAATMDNTRRMFADSWTNVTHLVPSAKDLILAGPRMGLKMGAFFLRLTEAVDDVLGGRIGRQTIPEQTAMGAVDAITSVSVFHRAASASSDIIEEAVGRGAGVTSRVSMEGVRSFGNVFQYSTSRWALGCIVMAIVLNRTHVYASTRRSLQLGWKVRFLIRIVPIILFAVQARWLLQAIQCQTSPDYAVLRYGNSSRASQLWWAQDSKALHTISMTMLFGASDVDSCHATSMIPTFDGEYMEEPTKLSGSLSSLWPLFETLCLSQFVETLSCAVQGRQVAAETGMTLFEHSLAFAEAEAAVSSSFGWGPFGLGRPQSDKAQDPSSLALERSTILRRANTAPEVLLVAFLSSMSHITSHVLAIFNLQGRLRLVNTAFWALCFMSMITWSILKVSTDDVINQAFFRFPTVCLIGFIPHVLLLAGIGICALIYGLALLLTALSPPRGSQAAFEGRSLWQKLCIAHQNMQASIPLTSVRVSMHMDFYTALLKTGLSILTMASEAVYLNESQEVSVKPMTWLEEDRLKEIEETGIGWLQPNLRSPDGEHYGRHGMADSVGLVSTKDARDGILRGSNSGYARERVASKAGKTKQSERLMRDGVGATERSGRWLMAFELFAGIAKLMISWWATVLLKFLAQIGIRRQPRWLLWFVRKPKKVIEVKRRQEKALQTLEFWMLGDDGELVLPEDESVDVELEMRKRLHSGDERALDANIYSWWLNGGWFGSEDNSGDFKPPSDVDDDDTTSVVSDSTAVTETDWLSADSDDEDDGQKTPTERSPWPSREGTPIADMPLLPGEFAQLLHPQTPEQRAEAQALAAHLASDKILTRSGFQSVHRRERARIITSARHHRPGMSAGAPTPEEEVEILEQLILSRRAFREATSSGKGPSSWAEGASGMGEGGPQCVVCQSAPRSIIVWPCRCLSLCDDCRVSLAMKNFETCTCCRGRVTSFSRIFVP